MIPAAFAPLATHLWQSTLFAAVAGVLTLALRRNQARVRYWLWLAASYKFLLPFSWLVSIGHRFEWRSAPAIVPPAFSAVTDMVSGPSFLTSFPAAKPAPDHLPVLLFAIWAIWAGGFVVVVAGWAREWLRVRAIVRAASPLPLRLPTRKTLGCRSEERSDEESLFLSGVTCGEILRFVQNDDKKQKALRVVSTAARLEPGVFGIFRPVLLLPAGITGRLTPAQLQAIVAHELCHVRRRDNLTAAVHMLVEALFWFYPLLWWLGARLIDEREAACDEEVLQSGGQAQVYAESVLKVCEFYLESPLTCMSGVTGSDLKKRMQRIMKNHLGESLGTRKKLLLTAAGIAALALPLLVGVLTAPRLRAQAPPDRPAFEVTSVKPLPPGDSTFRFEFQPGGRFVSTDPLQVAISFAYNLPLFGNPTARFTGGPDWILSRDSRYEIEATGKFPDGLSAEARLDRERLMVQALLADRFKLVIHREVKELPVYALVVAKGGPKLQKADIEEKDCPDRSATPAPDPRTLCHALLGGRGRGFYARAVSVSELANGFENYTDRPLVDKTGIKGLYHIETTPWLPIQLVPPPAPGAKAEDGTPLEDLPTTFEVFERLGLRLESDKDKVDVYVIDHIEKPSEN